MEKSHNNDTKDHSGNVPFEIDNIRSIGLLKKNCLVTLVACSLAACGGGSTTDDATNTTDTNVEFLGFVTYSGSFIEGDEGDAFATFFETTSPLTLFDLRELQAPLSDICRVSVDSDTFVSDTFVSDIDTDLLSISAGEVITFLTPAGSLGELVRDSFDFNDGVSGFEYPSSSDYPSLVPVGTTISIPGDQFPAFNEIPVPEIDLLLDFELVTQSSAAAFINPTTSYTWTPSSASGLSFVDLEMDNFATATEDVTYVSCRTIDDGNFTLPPEIQAQLGPEFSSDFVSIERVQLNIETEGNAALLVRSTDSFVLSEQ